MSAQFTSAWLAAHQAKAQPKQPALIPTDDDAEGDLHDMIIAWTNRQDPAVVYGHARMDKKSTYTEGFPDFILLLPGGVTLLIECKVGANDLSEAQQIFISRAKHLGHEVKVVRSYQEFLTAVKEASPL